jgi:cation:H+ antiporter
VQLEPARRVEVAFLAAAPLYPFVVPFTRTLAGYGSAVLLSLLALYLWRTSRAERSHPELIGVSAALGAPPAAAQDRRLGQESRLIDHDVDQHRPADASGRPRR